ncbi:O-antigen ligase family protein [Sphingomonas crusticola]|uniref:O-antigen ligase family protein n=1 Tax=Sphingomonas crusticola TaxID=1697973 RepID=UPI000E26B79F|nr:O-antigen ligase family protein [Sphingomonas crusticola]
MTKIVWRTLLALLLLIPIPLGSFRAGPWSIAGIVVALLSVAWMVLVATGRLRLFWRVWLWPPAVMFAGVVLWIVIQIAWPAPPGLAHPIWDLTAATLGSPVHARISADPEAGCAALIRLLSAAMIFWLVLQFTRAREHAIELVHCFAVAAAAIALYGLVSFITGNHYLLFYTRWAYLNDVTGTFVNRNTYATFAGLGLLALVTLFVDTYRRAFRETDPTLSWIGRRQAAMAGWPTAYLVGALIDAMALLQSHSRMGFLASLAGFVTLLLLLSLSRQLRGRGSIVVIVILVAGAFYASGANTFDRIAAGETSGRPALIALTRSAIATAPLIGSGYGSFETVFPMYRDTTLPGQNYEMAHSTYLELAMEIGILAAVAMVLSLLWFTLIALVGVFRRERDRSLPAIAVAASVLVAVHSMLDFSLQIPGVQYIFAALLGLGVAQAFPMAESAQRPNVPRMKVRETR